jgi:hypothetical protein
MSDKVKTTIALDKTIKKLAQIYALQNDMTLQELVEAALKEKIMDR